MKDIGTLFCILLFIGFGVYALYDRRLDAADEYHLIHGPSDGCPECESK